MRNYLDTLQKIMDEGADRVGRNGSTRAVFAHQLRFNLEEGFPAVTTKKLAFKSVVAELLWFLEGSGDNNRLKEILGTERTIWTKNAKTPYWVGKARFLGDLGRIYGVQWRYWRSPIFVPESGIGYNWQHAHWEIKKVDQISNLIEGLKKDPFDRRHIVTAWNPGELDQMALPPCHMIFQFFCYPDGRISLHMLQRSCDMFLGVPFNIASYALLLSMVAQVVNMRAYECVLTLNDAHIYHEHFTAVKKQLKREPLLSPWLWLNPEVKDIFAFTMEDIGLVDYRHHTTIKAEMIE